MILDLSFEINLRSSRTHLFQDVRQRVEIIVAEIGEGLQRQLGVVIVVVRVEGVHDSSR